MKEKDGQQRFAETPAGPAHGARVGDVFDIRGEGVGRVFTRVHKYPKECSQKFHTLIIIQVGVGENEKAPPPPGAEAGQLKKF